MFKLRSLVSGPNINPGTCIKLFDQLIKPICLYGSEIWGIEKLKYDSEANFIKCIESFIAEKIDLSFSKFALGVHRKAQTTAVRGELGRLPLGIDIIANIILYYTSLYKSKNPLMLELCRLQYITRSWICKAHDILQYFLQHHDHRGTSINRRYIKNQLKTIYEKHWINKIKVESKMRTYKQFKIHLDYENYLNILNAKYARSLTKFRISAHNLAIERGRYTRPFTPLELRTCPHCPNSIQDEIHFMISCTKHSNERDILFNLITEQCPQFTLLSPIEKLIYMVNAEGNVIQEVAKFIHKNMP